MNLYSWNVNGLRAAYQKGFLDWLAATRPDILGIQETKCSPDQLDRALRQPANYHTYWASGTRKGYSGTALNSRQEPRSVQIGLGNPAYDQEGRTIVADYDSFVLIVAYFPNGGRDLRRVPFKLAYCEDFLNYCNRLRADGRSVIFCGDINTAHQEIDLARPRENQQHTGFLPHERAWIDKVIANGYVDTFRTFHPDHTDAYSWWTYVTNARERNVGWRLDYFFVSQDLMPRVVEAGIHPDIYGSDHCPVSITLYE